MLSKSAVSRSLRLWLANGWPLRHLIQLIAALLCLWTTVATADEQGDLEGYFCLLPMILAGSEVCLARAIGVVSRLCPGAADDSAAFPNSSDSTLVPQKPSIPVHEQFLEKHFNADYPWDVEF